MPFEIVRNDITKMKVDAIVNAANSSLLGGGGVDGCIHRAAGPDLLKECRTLGGCRTGDAKITKGYRLPAKYVIHTVGPVWHGGGHGEKELLTSCYKRSLEIAKEYHLESVAFPLISAGVYGYPKDQAIRVATETITDFLMENDMTVYLVIFDKGAFLISTKLYANIAAYIDESYVEDHTDPDSVRKSRFLSAKQLEAGTLASRPEVKDSAGQPEAGASAKRPEDSARSCFKAKEMAEPCLQAAPSPAREPSESILEEASPSPAYNSLEDVLDNIDESFSEMLLRKIDEKGITDAECYKKANIDRKLFSKIRSNPAYKPSKPTAIAFAVALELPLEEAENMLMKAGFSFSHSSKFDLIVEYFIKQKNYNIFEINEALFAFDQSLLGA